MERTLWIKIAVILGLALALLIPLKLIESKIGERQATRAEVVTELSNTSVSDQTLSGPLLVVPCTDHYVEEVVDTGRGTRTPTPFKRDCTRSYIADELTVTGALKTENRFRGIYSARFYNGAFEFRGRFDIPADVAPANVTRERGAPFIAFSIRDVRGIRTARALSWSGTERAFKPGLRPDVAGAGVHAVVGSASAPLAGTHTFSFSTEILGLQNLRFVPSARQHEMKLAADWPHPSFGGRHLPVSREVARDGFQATWRISELASEAPRVLASCGEPACRALDQYAFGVNLLDPVDVYAQATRAVKYALLFVVLTFAAFFLFEIMRELRIHPIQYALVGLALAVFFLLLIALSEHLRFMHAYLISATACVALIAIYTSAVLRSVLRAGVFAAMLTALYTMLYALLRSEDHSLLLGALLVFAVLAAIMLLTRRIDWHTVARTHPPTP